MDFIERVFGLSPDGGSGWFEFLLFAIPLAGVAWLWRRRRERQRRDDLNGATAASRGRPSLPSRLGRSPKPWPTSHASRSTRACS